MRKCWSLVVGLVGITLVAAACGSSEGKQAARGGSEAGAGGDGTGVSAGGSQDSAGGVPQAGMPAAGGVGGEGAGAGGGGGEGGLAPLSIEVLAGDWVGRKLDTYFCETGISELQLKIEEDRVQFEGLPYSDVGSSGTITQQGEGFTLELTYEFEPGAPPITTRGQLYVEPAAQYAILVAGDDEDGDGYVAVLQRSTAPTLAFTPLDVAGSWAGTSVQLDREFAVTGVLPSSGTFTVSPEEDAVQLEGQDTDGAFSGEDTLYVEQDAWFWIDVVQQGDVPYGMAFLASADKRVLMATQFAILDDSEFYAALCDQGIFNAIGSHKFALWTKQD